MAGVGDRLARCFSSAFPAATEEDIRAADIAAWVDADSLAGVTLVALIDEEFGVDIDLEGLLRLGTFAAVARYLFDQDLANLSSGEQTNK